MEMDLHALAKGLLEEIANSIHDRTTDTPFCFNIAEVKLVEAWLHEFLVDLHKYQMDL